MFGKLFFLCLTYLAETLVVWRWNKLALATYYDTLYVSRLFDIRDSGGFPTCHSVLSVSVSMTLADSVSIRDHTVRMSFLSITSNQSFGFIHSYRLLLRSSLDTNLFGLYHSHSSSCTEVNTTALTRSSIKLSSLSFLQLNTINHDLHLRIIQTLCLHLSRSTPLRKTLTVNHCLHIEYFQQTFFVVRTTFSRIAILSSFLFIYLAGDHLRVYSRYRIVTDTFAVISLILVHHLPPHPALGGSAVKSFFEFHCCHGLFRTPGTVYR